MLARVLSSLVLTVKPPTKLQQWTEDKFTDGRSTELKVAATELVVQRTLGCSLSNATNPMGVSSDV